MAAELLAILAALSAMPLVLTGTKIKINTQKIIFVPGMFFSLNTYALLMSVEIF